MTQLTDALKTMAGVNAARIKKAREAAERMKKVADAAAAESKRLKEQ